MTAAIIGPRTMEHLESQLGAADVALSDDVLDRIDEIVPPGHEREPARRRLRAAGAGRGVAAPPSCVTTSAHERIQRQGRGRHRCGQRDRALERAAVRAPRRQGARDRHRRRRRRRRRPARSANATAHTVDSTDPQALEGLAAKVFEEDRAVDVLHNNAGIGHAATSRRRPSRTGSA